MRKDCEPMLSRACNDIRNRNAYPNISQEGRNYAADCFWRWLNSRPVTYWLPA